MIRMMSAALLTIALVASASQAQDGPFRRAGRAIDNAGRNVRDRVDTEVARGQLTAQEKELLNRVSYRLSWDKQISGSTLQLVIQADGTAILRGSVLTVAAKKRAVDLAESTVGVTRVVDELAVVKDVQVIEARPAARVIEVVPVTVPPETRVIVKP